LGSYRCSQWYEKIIPTASRAIIPNIVVVFDICTTFSYLIFIYDVT
jgi:hypothetical protein